MLNKNTWGVKKCRANQKQHCKQRIKGGQVTKPIILGKICYNIVSFKELQIFGCACLFAMLLLIGPALFYTPGVFV